jgi:5-oxopent-3-ene-1,2,5-tricarboxylate decarboxylase / 2-hydroxyhepta-2,4-diene-1,7-dioate isomerase
MTAPTQPHGTVYGVLMNTPSEWRALESAMAIAPYQAPPQAPVLYIKPANTFSASGDVVRLPARVQEVEAWVTVAMCFSAPALLNTAQAAINLVVNTVLVCDWTVPHTSYFRPPVRAKCWDTSLAIGSVQGDLADVQHTPIQVRINGIAQPAISLADLVRSPAQLVADVNAFMTLQAGDLLMLGSPVPRLRLKAGDHIHISAPGLGEIAQEVLA